MRTFSLQPSAQAKPYTTRICKKKTPKKKTRTKTTKKKQQKTKETKQKQKNTIKLNRRT